VARAGEDHVLGFLDAEKPGALFSQHPTHRIGDVGFAGAVRPDNRRRAHWEGKLDPAGKGLKSLEFQAFQIQLRFSNKG